MGVQCRHNLLLSSRARHCVGCALLDLRWVTQGCRALWLRYKFLATETKTQTTSSSSLLIMSTFANFAIVGAGNVGKPLINEFLKLKADGAISSVTLVTRSVYHSQNVSIPVPSLNVLFRRTPVIPPGSPRASSTPRSTTKCLPPWSMRLRGWKS